MNHLPAIVEEEIAKVKAMTDKFGRPVDEQLVLIMAALRCHGFVPTTASNPGHAKWFQPPWVSIEAPDAPKLMKIMQDGPHSGPEFLENRRAVVGVNRQENHRLFKLLAEFYESRHLSYRTALTITEIGPGRGQLCPHAGYLVDQSTVEVFSSWLEQAQAEMSAFVDFLIAKL